MGRSSIIAWGRYWCPYGCGKRISFKQGFHGRSTELRNYLCSVCDRSFNKKEVQEEIEDDRSEEKKDLEEEYELDLEVEE